MAQKTIKRSITPTQQELLSFTKDLDALLVKHSMYMRPTLKTSLDGITAQISTYKVIEVPVVEPETTPDTAKPAGGSTTETEPQAPTQPSQTPPTQTPEPKKEPTDKPLKVEDDEKSVS